MVQTVHKNEWSNVFDLTDNKLDLKIDTTGNVELSKSANGLKANVEFPAIPDVPTALKSITVEGNKLKLTNTKDEVKDIELPAQAVDVKLQGAEVTADNKLKLTLSDGSVVEADLAKFVDAPKTAQEYWDEIRALPTFKADLLAVLKGEVMQNLAGRTFGYLLAAE